MNLLPLFSEKEISEAFRVLKGRRFKENVTELKRFSRKEEKELNSLGKYLVLSSPTVFYRDELKDFNFLPYKGIKIIKSNGKPRPLLIPAPKDRIILAAAFPKIRTILDPYLQKADALGLGFGEADEGEVKEVLTKIQSIIQQEEYRFILKLDFKDFFSSINRSKLLKKLKPYFRKADEERLFALVKKSIQNAIDASPDFHGTFGRLKLRINGIPQGLAFSPLLASFYAVPLDVVVKKIEGCVSFRYLDDMIVLGKTSEQINDVYKALREESTQLKLALHDLVPGSKTRLIDMNAEENRFEFLGVGISKEGLFVPDDAIVSFKKTFEREIVNEKIILKFSFEEIFEAYKVFVKGWLNYYKNICSKDFEKIEKDLNDHISSYIEKPHRRETMGKFFGDIRLSVSEPFKYLK